MSDRNSDPQLVHSAPAIAHDVLQRRRRKPVIFKSPVEQKIDV
jgi:hypothetical protein